MPTQQFTYSSVPHAVKNTGGSKSHQNKNDVTPLTLMSDPRVVRGSTHALARKVAKYRPVLSSTLPARSAKIIPEEQESQPTYEYDVKPFAKPEIDFSDHLVLQGGNKTLKHVEMQTNEFLPRPESPPYVPKKTGVDNQTQVEDVRDLFNFDVECIPILNVIVSKTLEQALWEIQSEEELICLEKEAERHNATIEAEEAWVRQQELEFAKEAEVIRTKMAKIEAEKEEEKRTKETIAALQMATQIVSPSVESILEELLENKTWKMPLDTIIDSEVLPYIYDGVAKKTKAYEDAMTLMEGMTADVEERFNNLPIYTYSPTPIPMELVFLVKGQSATEESPEIPDERVSINLQIDLNDTINSIDAKIESEIVRIKQTANPPPPAEEEPPGDADVDPSEVTAQKAVQPDPEIIALAAKLPDLSPGDVAGSPSRWPYRSRLPFNFYSMMSSLINTLLSDGSNHHRNIAPDAILFNFPLPTKVTIEVSMVAQDGEE